MTPEEEAAFEARLDSFFQETFVGRLQEAAETLFREDPHLFVRILAGLVKGGLESLRYYIENPGDPDVSWANPFTELHYPVEWDWQRGGLIYLHSEDIPPHATDAIAEALRKGEDPLKAAKDAAEELGVILLGSLVSEAMVLHALTNHVAVHVRGAEEVGCFLAPEDKARLDNLPTPEERASFVAQLRQPFAIGGAETHPSLSFRGEVNGAPFSGSVVFVVDPLVVDEDAKRAFFPITVGLVLSPGDTGRNVQALDPEGGQLGAPERDDVDPSTWAEDDRAGFWARLIEDLPKAFTADLVASQGASPTPERTAPPPSAAPAVTATALAVVTPPLKRPPTVGLAFGRTLASVQALRITRDAYKVRLPKRWSALPRWEALMRDQVKKYLEEEGARAFEDLRKTTGDPKERGPLLRRVTRAGGKEEVVLTAEAQDRLRRRAGLGKGYLDIDRTGQERLYKLFTDGRGGLIEVGLSWQGLAGPLVEEWRASFKRQADELARDLKRDAPLFVELDEDRRRRLDRALSQMSLWEDGRRVMEVILGQVGKQRRNPVEIPAEAFRVLLWPKRAKSRDWPQNWKQRVDGALSALNALTFSMKTYHMEQVKAYGSMVGQWLYKGRGHGDHGDGVYIIDVSSGFIGCLQVFQSGKQRLRSGMETLSFHFSKDLTQEERKAFGWGKGQRATDTFVSIDAGRAFYNAAADLTPTQENLLHFIETHITLRGNTARPGHKEAQVQRNAADAKEPRIYTSAFCPLLPEGKPFLGALGNFARNPEAGFTLGGSESRAARHHGGLLYHMGYNLPPGAARAKRAAVVKKALEDIRDIVVTHLEGQVVGHDGVNWIAFDRFWDLDEQTLTRRLRLFIFLPETWEEKRKTRWEETTGRRVTEDPEEAERETWEGETSREDFGGEVVSEENGFRGWPLPRRLEAMKKRRGVRNKALAGLFGVSPMTVSYWLAGTKKIPSYMVPLVVRWIETGEPPSSEELTALMPRRHTAGGRPKRSR